MPTLIKLIKIKAITVSMQTSYSPPTMELIADNSSPNSKPREYVIDREELLHLKESGLIQSKLYVYLAIKLSYDTQEPSIDIPWFCEQWELKEAEFTNFQRG